VCFGEDKYGEPLSFIQPNKLGCAGVHCATTANESIFFHLILTFFFFFLFSHIVDANNLLTANRLLLVAVVLLRALSLPACQF
jgi:hypothetical protein